MQRTKKNRKEERRKKGGKEGRKDTSNEHLSNIYNQSDEHQSQNDRTPVGNQSEVYRISIRRKSFENQPDEHYQHLAKITKYTHNWINTTRSAWKPKCSSIVIPQENPQITIASKKVASFRFNQKKSSRNSQQLNLTERGHPNRSHFTQAMADRCTVCLDFLTTRTIGYSTCRHVFHAECLRGWFGLPCPTCRATWTRDMTQAMANLNAAPILMNRRQFFTNQRLPPPMDVVGWRLMGIFQPISRWYGLAPGGAW